MQVPVRSEQEALSHEVFNALLWALSYPGRQHATPHANLTAIGQTLLDLETSFYTPDDAVKRGLLSTGAREVGLEAADYLFFSSLDDAAPLQRTKRGDLLYPDHSATFVFRCQLGEGLGLELRGPGVESVQKVRVSGIPESFWHLRNQTRRYPLGWDVFLCDGAHIVGVPRSAEVKI